MSDSLLAPKPIITISEARKLLGKDGKYLSDEQVTELVKEFSTIAKFYIKEQSDIDKE
jgi:hypothetical protein